MCKALSQQKKSPHVVFSQRYFDWNGRNRENRNAQSDRVWVLTFAIILVIANMIIDAPAGLKKDLNKLIDIQQKLEILTNTINSAMNSLGIRQGRSSENAVVFAEIDSHKSRLMETCEKLYTSLNIPGDFNNNQGIVLIIFKRSF